MCQRIRDLSFSNLNGGKLSSSEKRKPYEFPWKLRKKLVEEHPEIEKPAVHHQLPIWQARQLHISPKLVKSRLNAEVMEASEHRRLHRGKCLEGEEWKIQEFLAMQRDCEDL